MRFAAKNKVDTLDDLQQFEGPNGEYSFCAIESSESKLVFERKPKIGSESKKRATKSRDLVREEKNKVKLMNGSFALEEYKKGGTSTSLLSKDVHNKKSDANEKETDSKSGRVTKAKKIVIKNGIDTSSHRRSTRIKLSRKL